MKRRSNRAAWMVPGLVIVGTGLLGCESNERARADVDERSRPDYASRQTTARTQTERERSRTLGTMAESFSATSSMAFPTGDPDTSSVLIEKALPREVLLGQEFEYQIRVTNLTDQPLVGVRVREFSESPAMHGGRGGQVMTEPVPAGRTFGVEAPTQELAPGQNGWNRPQDGLDQDDLRDMRQDADRELDELEDDAEDAADDLRRDMDDQIDDGQPAAGAQPSGRVLDEQQDDAADFGADPDRLGDEGVARPNDLQDQNRRRNLDRPALGDPPLRDGMDSRNLGMQGDPLDAFADTGAGGFREYTIDRLEPGETRTITATAVANDPGLVQLCSTVIYQPVLCSTTMVIAPELQVTKTGPEVASVCEPLTYTITVTNTGVGPAEGVVLTEDLPEGFTAQNARGGELTLDVGTLAAGESREFTITARGENPGEFTNRTIARSARGLTAEAQTTTRLVEPQLEVEKLGPAEAFTGVPMEFVINVRNVGDIPVRNLRVEDAAPRGARFVAATENGRFANGSTTWQLNNLAPGETRTFAVRLENSESGAFENCVRILTDCGQPITDCVTVTLESITGLRLLIIDQDDPIAIGDDELYTVQVKNQGGSEATNVQVAINLPAEFTMVSATGPQGAAARPQPGDQAGVFVFDPIPVLAPGQTVEWRVVARGQQSADARVGARLTADQLTRPVIANESTRIFDASPARPVAPADQPPAPDAGPRPGSPAPGAPTPPAEPTPLPGQPTPPPGQPGSPPETPDDSGLNDPIDDSPATAPGESDPR